MKRPEIGQKDYLNSQETIEYFHLSPRKFYALLKQDNHSFIALYRDRKLIIRAEFEQYFAKHPELRRRAAYGKKNNA